MSINQPQPNQYELVQQLASNAPVKLWKAFDASQHRYVLLSLIPFHPQADLARYQHDMSVLQSLHHPHIAQVHSVQLQPQQGQVITVTDFIDGPTLAESLQALTQAGSQIPLTDLPGLLAPIASAIDQAHQHGVVHNALNPSNILLDRHNPDNTPAGTPSLIGFCSCYLYPPQALSPREMAYISPELAQGHTENARSDLYSLGVILYELCTGALPFHGDTAADIMVQHLHSTPISPALINPHLPPALTAVIMRALSRDPLARFPTAASLVLATARALNIPAHDILDQIGATSGSTGSTPWLDSMHSPTYLSGFPLPSASQPTEQVSAPGLAPASVTSLTPRSFPSSPVSYSTVQQTPNFYPSAPPEPSAPIIADPNIPRPPQKPQNNKRMRFYTLVVLPLLVILIGVGVAGYMIANNTLAGPAPIIGHAFFASSGQLNLNTNEGIADQIRVSVDGLPEPPSGKMYYFWLLADPDNTSQHLPVQIGTSNVGKHVDLTYDKNTRHENLLASYSRLLVTLEDSASQATSPTPDTASWRYYAAFTPKKEGQFSQLDHLRHLLSKDPKLQQLPTPLNGGLDIWLFRNTLKVLEAAGSARDGLASGDVGLAQRQLVRILDYLDGSQYVQTEKLPPGMPYLLIPADVAQVAILEIDEQNQSPPGYLKHINNHLNELSQLQSATPAQKKLAIQINTAINNVQGWMVQIHLDTEQLLQMTTDQLRQPAAQAKLNEIFTLANYAFTGKLDPNTDQVREGISQIHYNDLRLATFDVRACKSSNASNPCV